MSTDFTLEQRKHMHEIVCIEKAKLLKIMKEHFGEEAYQVFAKVQGEEKGAHFSKLAVEGGDNSIEALIKILLGPEPHDFVYTLDETDAGFQMHVTTCPIYDMAKCHGITEQMFHDICAGDPYMAEGFNPNIGFKRTKTLMEGHDCCDHFYYYKDKNK